MQKYIFIAWIVAQSAWVGAQPAYGPGTFKLTPKREATLQPVSVQIPPEFDHLPRDLTLNLPPGFSAACSRRTTLIVRACSPLTRGAFCT